MKQSKNVKTCIIPEQLLLFDDPIEDRLIRKVKELEDSLERNRKSLHAKSGHMQKVINDLQMDMEFIKRGICQAALHRSDRQCEIFELALL